MYNHSTLQSIFNTGCSLNIVFFPRILESHLSLASTQLLLVVQNNYKPIGMNVHSLALRALKVSCSDVGEGGVAVNCLKKHNFS